ncbi:protein-L-isoaspartate(D-aspartate) O-methyltransferase [Aureibacter tunicatorum]|uniref:Protein-L-isoaspartate O-methyltransferase n=1 Tax=Aureibacter tunicatorum TaxID=866807 RepID=A0AAE3XNF6_9BACT|nr:protein-L-isoaspartate(D-aspartate) O-methyltransferase [Aureibacter tunicatorum]MDR6239720.1 protein-L-isoaspartate(D-aspartate) O-methyltransferase [Aureibacter tunicatorum]BDD04196.1 protein-L-isoaspartate O-methyltransferase [Aureibacter tunicatorum]
MRNLRDTYKTKGQRRRMVMEIEKLGFHDQKVLEALNKVPRHYFFEKAFEEHAYENKPFPIGEDQTISQPSTVAFQTSLLNIKPGDRVLEIGTGSGYQASILAELQAEVHTVEVRKSLAEKASHLLEVMGYANVKCYVGDGTLPFNSLAPFDSILVTAAAPSITNTLVNQLNNRNGKLVIPVGDLTQQVMTRITYCNGELKKEEFGKYAFVPLVGKEGWSIN